MDRDQDQSPELLFEERRLVDRFTQMLVNAREQAQAAPPGTIIDRLEGIFLDQGRDLLRESLQTELQHQADQAEKKGGAVARNAETIARTKGQKSED